MSANGGSEKPKIESLNVVFAGTNLPAARQAFKKLHELTPEKFRSDLETVAHGGDTLWHMEFYCFGLTETSFKNAVTAHLWCPASDDPSPATWDKLLKDCRGLAFFLTEDLELGKQGLVQYDTMLKRVGSELKKTPILILPTPGDEPFEPMAKALDRPVRNLFDSEPETGYRMFLAVRILINRNLPEQPPRPMAFTGQYSYDHKPPQSSLMRGDDVEEGREDITDLLLGPEDTGSKKSTFNFSEDDKQNEERRRGLFGRLMGKKKK
ncbi:hypothetical protein KQI52_03640 [bacterium]|nr:hypothetical protein [bacterium]